MVRRKFDRNRLSIFCWYLSVLVILCLLGLVAWLSLIPKDPRFRISNAQFPNLLSRNHSIVSRNSLLFDIEISNPNKRMGIYYSGINLELYSGGGGGGIVGTNSSKAFYQGQKGTTSVKLGIHANREFWQGMNRRNFVGFMIRVETAVRFRIIRWKTKLRQIEYEAYFSKVEITANGTVSGGYFTGLQNAPKVKTGN